MQKEIWNDIPEYEGLYQVSNLGRILALPKLVNYRHGKRINKCRYLNPKNNGNGYYLVRLTKNKISQNKYVHILVGTVFIPNTERKPQINHIDGIKSNNIWSNLEWCNQSQNNIHAYKTGLRFPTGVCTLGRIDPKRKPVYKLSLSGNILEEYVSVLEAAKKNNVNSGRISTVCKKNCNLIVKGFTYKFKNK